MKKRFLLSFIFIGSLIISLFLFLPYGRIYRVVLDKMANENHINLSYDISKASLFGVSVSNIRLGNLRRLIDRCSIYIDPLGFVFSGKVFDVTVEISSNKANFTVEKKDRNYIITGVFNTQMILPFLNKNLTVFLKGFKGKNNVYLNISPEMSGIRIKSFRVMGGFELIAHGFIRKGKLDLMGVIKLGKLKQSFSI